MCEMSCCLALVFFGVAAFGATPALRNTLISQAKLEIAGYVGWFRRIKYGRYQ